MQNVKIDDSLADISFENAMTSDEIPYLKARLEKKQDNQTLDNEVISWISQQDSIVKQHFNDMLRREMSFIKQQQAILKTC